MKYFYMILIFVALQFLFGCAHNHSKSASIKIDVSQLISFDEARKDPSTEKSPALYKFKIDEKTLWYLASNHTTDSSSGTFRFIRHVFSTQKIDLAIVEGFETSLGVNPMSIRRSALKGKTATFYPNGEPSFVIESTDQKGIPFIGGEPSEREIYDAALKKGFDGHDLVAFYFVRQIPQLKRAKEIQDLSSIEKSFESYSKEKATDFGIKDFVFSYSDFKNWYKKNQSKELSIESGERGETAPIDGPYYTQKISKVITTIRDEHILKTIADMMNKHKNVLIVYGSSHYRVEHKALKSAFGAPTEIDIKDIQ